MSCISVLRIGPFTDDNECAAQLRTALVEHFGKLVLLDAEKTAHDQTQNVPTTFESHQIISIANKYFTAKVLLATIGDHQSNDDDSINWTEDGIVLVFDSILSNPKFSTSMTASFDAMEAIHDCAVAADTAGDLLRLCIGVGNSKFNLTEKEYEQEYARRVLWCLDRGYEYVEADLTEEGVLQGHDARDKEGFARIVEAVSGTVWSSAIMERRKQHELKDLYAHDAELAAEEAAASATTGTYEPPDPSKLPPIILGSNEETDEEREQKARAALLAEEADAIYLDHHDDVKDTDTARMRREEMEQERSLNSLEGSLRDASRLRELAKSGQLSDDERRKRAGDAAMLLMDMMGGMGGFDESSDDDESLEDGKEEKIDAAE